VKTVDCIVTGVRVEGRDNCHVSLIDGDQLVEVGSCAMLGKPPVVVGQVVEVRYLYADTNRRLVQPAFLRVRDDKPAVECTIDQLVFTNRTVLDQGGLIQMANRDPGKGLGRTQIEVMHLLALGPKTVRDLTREGLSDSNARSTLQRLGLRGLVDRKFKYNELEYFLTKTGEEVEQLILDEVS
jgi:hypothetical protein